MTPESKTKVGVGQQIPRLSLALLMLAQAAVIVPHGAHLSWWIIGVGLVCAWWRWMVFQGRWDFPARWIKAVLVGGAVLGVTLDGAGPFSLEAATALLIVAFALKLLEMKNRRDAYLVIFLCYFVIATEFLFDQSIMFAAYEFAAVIVVTAAMVGLNQMHTRVRPVDSLKTAGVLVVQALPLMLVLFLFFPRIAPLWSVPLPGGTQTGITDRVAPGDIARLTQSDAIAFRVDFEDGIPTPRSLYWRGLVYSNYEAGVWTTGALATVSSTRGRADMPGDSAAGRAGAPASADLQMPPEAVRYEVLQEPTQAIWLFALETPRPVDDRVSLTADYRLVADEPIHGLYRFRAESYPRLTMDLVLPGWLERRETRLPEGENPRLAAFAETLRGANPDPRSYLEAILRYIREEPYRYTLKPPRLEGLNSIDAFWFDTRAGFCSHFAGAFVYLARLAGIPARMVGGYQGGEVNPITGHLVVRQYDAHAWAEAWIAGSGWVRYDPTAAVAPARIERGLDAALSEPDRAALAALTTLRWDGIVGLSDVLYYLESLEHRWNLQVVGYDGAMQHRYLTDLLGAVSPTRIGIVMLLGGAGSLALVAATLFWRRRPSAGHPVERIFQRFATRLARVGLARAPAETPRQYLSRVGDRAGRSRVQTAQIVESLDRLLYNPAAPGSGREMRDLRRGLRRLQLEASLRARD